MGMVYSVFHGHDIFSVPWAWYAKQTAFFDAYTVTFVEQLNLILHTCEDTWLDKRNTQINIQSMILHRVK